MKLGETKGNFEIDKFTWIGNMDQTIGTCVVHKRANIASFQDLFARKAVFGASGPSAVNSIHVRGFNALLGTRIQIVNGYPGSTDVLLAMSRGEADGGCGFALSSLKTTRRQDWESGEIRAIIQTGFEKSDEASRTFLTSTTTRRPRTTRRSCTCSMARTRSVVRSRPRPVFRLIRVKALRDAFSATMKDPVFLAEAGKQDMPIDPWTGDQTEQVIVQFTSYPPAIYSRARTVLEAAEAK